VPAAGTVDLAWRDCRTEAARLMVGPNPFKVGSFAELRHFAQGPLWVRCDRCRRFRRLIVGDSLKDRDYRTTRFRCLACGGRSWVTIDRPDQQDGMTNYRLDTDLSPLA
jgi:hypothetical protein